MDENPGAAGVRRAVHVTLAVSDFERSVRYYCEGLGFSEVLRMEMGQEIATVGQFDGDVRFQSVLVSRDGMVLQLANFPQPGVTDQPGIKPLNEAGFTHIGIVVEDVDRALDALVRLGGTVLEGSRTRLEGADIVMTLDPDGTRVEIERVDNLPV